MFLISSQHLRSNGKAPKRADRRRSYPGTGTGNPAGARRSPRRALAALLITLGRNAELECELSLSRDAISNGFPEAGTRGASKWWKLAKTILASRSETERRKRILKQHAGLRPWSVSRLAGGHIFCTSCDRGGPVRLEIHSLPRN